MRGFGLKVGELAKRTGLTIRTLHHYDEIGLVRPSLHLIRAIASTRLATSRGYNRCCHSGNWVFHSNRPETAWIDRNSRLRGSSTSTSRVYAVRSH